MLGPVLAEIEKSREIFALARGWKHAPKKKAGGARRANGKSPPPPAAAAVEGPAYFSRFVEAGKQIPLLAGLDEALPNTPAHPRSPLAADPAEVLLPKDDAFEVARPAAP